VIGRVDRRWAVLTAASGTVFIAAGAFWLSFTALADLAARSGIGTGQAWAWPLIVDGIIVVATVAVVALGGQRAAWYPWALLFGGALVSVTANAIHAVVAADEGVPRVLAASVAAVPPVVLLAITHLTVILTRSDSASESDPIAASHDEAAAPRSAPHPTATALPASSSQLPSPPVAEARGVQSPGPLNSASRTADGDRRARARAMSKSKKSNRQIARELGVHPSTVGRWLNEDDTATEARSRSALSPNEENDAEKS